jgi:hypothetical protein
MRKCRDRVLLDTECRVHGVQINNLSLLCQVLSQYQVCSISIYSTRNILCYAISVCEVFRFVIYASSVFLRLDRSVVHSLGTTADSNLMDVVYLPLAINASAHIEEFIVFGPFCFTSVLSLSSNCRLLVVINSSLVQLQLYELYSLVGW